MTTIKKKTYLADISSRLGALLVDVIILGGVGLLLGLIFESVFIKLGHWGPLVGVIIMLLYFGIGNSQRAGGQTLGKKLLKIRVVDKSGTPLSLGKSMLRAIVLITPFALNGQPVFGDNPPSILIYLLTAIIFGGIFAIIYLLFFNRSTKQSLHDLAANSIVININSDKQSIAPIWKGHLVIVALLFLISAAVPAFINDGLTKDNDTLQELTSVQKALLSEPNISSVGVYQNTYTFTDNDGSSKVTESLSIEIPMDKNNIRDEDFARDVAKKAYSSYALASKVDMVYVSLSYGYDIGIASKSQSYRYEFESNELKQ